MPDDVIPSPRDDEDLAAQELALEDLEEVAGGTNVNCGDPCNENCATVCLPSEP
jgi:hypothetical protein